MIVNLILSLFCSAGLVYTVRGTSSETCAKVIIESRCIFAEIEGKSVFGNWKEANYKCLAVAKSNHRF